MRPPAPLLCAAALLLAAASPAMAANPPPARPPLPAAEAEKPKPSPAPVNPFAPAQPAPAADYLPGAIYLSDGTIHVGGIQLTKGKSLLVFHPARKQHVDVPLETLREIKVRVVATREEKEWRFKEGGSAEKVFSGKTYFRLDFGFEFVFKEGEPLTADLAQGAPVYLLPEKMPAKEAAGAKGEQKPEKPTVVKLMLQPFQMGAPGQKLEDLVHITRIALGEAAQAEARGELEKRPPQEQKRSAAEGGADVSASDSSEETAAAGEAVPPPVRKPQKGYDPVEEMNYWTLYIIVFFTFSQLLLLGFVCTLAYRVEKLMRQVRELSQDASKFVRMGVQFFKSQK